MKTNKQIIDEWADMFKCKGNFLYVVEDDRLEILCDKVRREYQDKEDYLLRKVFELEKRIEKLEKKPSTTLSSSSSAYDLSKSKIPEGWTTTRRGGLRQLGVYDG